MGRGRKKTPTKIKELQGTLKPERQLANEMQVSLVQEIPEPPQWLTEIGQEEWMKVCGELFNKRMLHQIDLRLIEAYCNAMALHIETEMMLRDKGRIQVFKNSDGTIKHTQSVPFQKIANDALDRALKLATQFGFTPSARTSIQQPTFIQQNNEYNFFD
jgi:P27 family predicted phage terminase small subunit